MRPDFASARLHVEAARDILDVDDDDARRMVKIFDLTIEALVAAEAERGGIRGDPPDNVVPFPVTMVRRRSAI